MDSSCTAAPSSSSSPKIAFVASAPSSSSTANWYVDSAATTHVTPDLDNLHHYKPYYGYDQVTVGNGTSIPIQHTGQGILSTPSYPFKLNNILHVPFLSSNLLSVHQLTSDNDCTITFDDKSFVIQDKTT